MSEMIKNSDVEDVLFSIRRLVSDTPNAAPDAVLDDETENKAGALILTSALRVNDPATEPEQIDLDDMTSDLSHFRDAVGRDEQSVEEYPSLDEVFADKAPEDQPRRLHLSEVVTGEKPAATEDEYFEDEDTGDLAERKWVADPAVETLGDFATDDDKFGTSVDEALSDIATGVEETPAEMVPSDWLDGVATEAAEILNRDSAQVAATAGATIEDLIKDANGTDAADLRGDVEEIAPQPEQGSASETVSEDIDTGVANGLADFDESILDEDALRDMVTEIVREELSGELGERITRNVRKLVRREIHRALMTREFD